MPEGRAPIGPCGGVAASWRRAGPGAAARGPTPGWSHDVESNGPGQIGQLGKFGFSPNAVSFVIADHDV
eukprot:2210617-Prymnesium_polylepis.1